MTKSASVLVVASVVVVLLAFSVARQYRWVTELSDLQQQQTDRSLRLSADGFVRQVNREFEELWYVLHVRAGRAAEEELADDFARRAESARVPDLLAEAWWVADAGSVDGVGSAGLEARSISLADGTFSEAVANPPIAPAIVRLAELPVRSRRRNFGPRDGFLIDAAGHRQAFVVPQPALRPRAWAVAVLSAEAMEAWLSTLVAEHFGAADSREFDVRVFRSGDHDVGDAIYVSNAANAGESWETPDVVSRTSYVTVAVRHREGSVAIAAANVRWANLAFTFGTVAVLLVGLGALAVVTRRAERLVKRQTEFVAGVSHELRTPLSGISVLSQNLADGVVQDVGQAAVYGRSIHRESRRLRDMVEGVLQLSAIRSGGFQYEFVSVDIADVVDDSLEGLEPTDRAAVAVTIAGTVPAIRGDRRALSAALRNLVSNALKFGGQAPEVRLTVRQASRRGAPVVVVEVADTGCGIDAADRRHVFDAFYRGRAAHEAQTAGSGLGLSLVRSVAAAHHGTVDVTSTPGAGSTFTMTLPAPRRGPDEAAG